MSTLQTINIKHPSASTPTITFISSTNQATINAGSASAPVLSFIGDENTGLWSPGADTVAFSTGGTERMRITNAGRVGINTTSPSQTLSIDAGSFAITTTSNDAASESIVMRKIRDSSIVSSGDAVGAMLFQGYDGAAYRTLGVIRAAVDGTPGSGDMPGRLMFLTTPDGSTTDTERMRIDNAGLITGTGTSLGAWTAYTPTLSGTGWAIGNGTIAAAYCRVGKIVYYRISVVWGSTSTYGSGFLAFTLPVNNVSSINDHMGCMTRFVDTSAGNWYGGLGDTYGNSIYPYGQIAATGQVDGVKAAVPFTWDSGDYIYLTGMYEAA